MMLRLMQPEGMWFFNIRSVCKWLSKDAAGHVREPAMDGNRELVAECLGMQCGAQWDNLSQECSEVVQDMEYIIGVHTQLRQLSF